MWCCYFLLFAYNTASIGSSLGFGKEHESVKNVTIQRMISHKNVHMEVCDKLYKRRVYLQWPRLKASTPKKCLERVYFWWLPFSALSITSDNPSQVSRVVVAVETLDLNDNAPELDRQYSTAMCDSASTGQVREQATCYYGRKEGHTCLHWLVHLLLHQNVKAQEVL